MAYIAAQLGRLSLHPEVSGLSKNVSVSTSRREKSKSSQQKQPGPVQTCGRRIVCSNAASLLVGSEKSTVSKHYKSRSYAKRKEATLPDCIISLMDVCSSPSLPPGGSLKLGPQDNAALDRLVLALGRHKATWKRSLILYEWLRENNHEFDERLCASLIRICSRYGMQEKALSIYSWMRQGKSAGGAGLRCSVFTYTSAMKAALISNDFDRAMVIWHDAFSAIPQELDAQIKTVLIEVLGKRGDIQRALDAYNEVKQYNEQQGDQTSVQTYTVAMKAAADGGRFEEAFSIWKDMQNAGVKPSAHAYATIISAYGSSKKWEKSIVMFDRMLSSGVKADVVSCTALLDALTSNGQWKRAEKVLSWMKLSGISPNVRSYSVMVSGYATSMQWHKAEALMAEMKSGSLGVTNTPNQYTYSILLKALAETGNWRKAESVFQEIMEAERCRLLAVHGGGGEFPKSKKQKHSEASTQMSAIWKGDTAATQGIELVVHKNNKPDTHFIHCQRTKSSLINEVVCGAMMYAYERSGRWEEALKFLKSCNDLGSPPNRIVYNTALSAMAKACKVKEAENILSQISNPDDITYETMIAVYGLAGQPEKAELIFSKLISEGYHPKDYAFCGLLASYTVSGHVKAAFDVERRAKESGITESVHLYNGLLAACDRFHKYEKALALLEEMKRLGIKGNSITKTLAVSVCADGMRSIENQQAAFTALSAIVAAAGSVMIRAGVF